MARKDQKSLTIPLKDWNLAEREAQKESKTPTRWIREQIHIGAGVELEVPTT